MAIIKGARNLDAAKKFYDWALTPEGQKVGLEVKEFAIPTNRSVPLPPQVPKLTDIKVIDYDFAKYGASDTRKRLPDRWERTSMPRRDERLAAGSPPGSPSAPWASLYSPGTRRTWGRPCVAARLGGPGRRARAAADRALRQGVARAAGPRARRRRARGVVALLA